MQNFNIWFWSSWSAALSIQVKLFRQALLFQYKVSMPFKDFDTMHAMHYQHK